MIFSAVTRIALGEAMFVMAVWAFAFSWNYRAARIKAEKRPLTAEEVDEKLARAERLPFKGRWRLEQIAVQANPYYAVRRERGLLVVGVVLLFGALILLLL